MRKCESETEQEQQMDENKTNGANESEKEFRHYQALFKVNCVNVFDTA